MVRQSNKPSRFDIYLVSLDPTQGAEIQKTRPCVVISPNEMNDHLATVIIAPMTTKSRAYPTRVSLIFNEKKGQIILDQIRTLDQIRLIKKLGQVSKSVQTKITHILQEMFSE